MDKRHKLMDCNLLSACISKYFLLTWHLHTFDQSFLLRSTIILNNRTDMKVHTKVNERYESKHFFLE